MQQYICLVAGGFLKATEHRFEETIGDFDLAPEADETLNFYVSIKNLGYASNIENLTAELSTIDENVTITDGQWTTAGINSLETEEAQFEISIGADAQSGDTVIFTIHFSAADGYELSQDYEVILGSPFMIFYDNAENGTGNWDTGLGWGTSDEKSSEGEFSFSDSPYANYADMAENQFTLLSGIDLSGMNNAFLKFDARWNLEAHFDEAQVSLITDNLFEWQIEEGIHTTGGTGIGVQELGEPVYNGFRDLAWFQEKISLTDYLAGGFKVRFSLNSDEALNEEGFYVDEVQVLCYSEELQPPIINQVIGNSVNTSDTGPFPVSVIAGDAQGITDVALSFSINGGVYISVTMEISELMNFYGELPVMSYGDEVSYLVEVTDEEGNVVQSDLVTFLVTDSYPVISVTPESMSFYLTEPGEVATQTITIENVGFLPLEYTISEREPEQMRNLSNNSQKKRDTLKRDLNEIISDDSKKKTVLEPDESRDREWIEIVTDENDIDTPGFPDFLSLSAEVTDTHLNLEMTVEMMSSWSNCAGIISLDADQDIDTGVFPCGLGIGTELQEVGSEFEIIWDPSNVTGNGNVAIVLDGAGDVFYGLVDIQTDGNVTSASIPLAIFDDDMNMNLVVTIVNVNNGEADYAPESGYAVLGSPAPLFWMSEDPVFGTVEYNETGEVVVTVSSLYMENGTYEAEIVIESNDPLNPEIVVPVTFEFDAVGADDENSVPVQTALFQNYPNPFNPSTTISFNLTTENAKNAEIGIYNVKGRKVKTIPIHPSTHSPFYSVTWNGEDESGKSVSSGIYFYKLKTEKESQIKKMILMK